jgi:hypothetical protein
MAKCLDSQAKQMAGMFCMGCNACYSDYISESSSSITVSMDQDSCSEMSDSCSKYMKSVKELKDKFKEFKSGLRAILNTAIKSGTVKQEDVNDGDLDKIIDEEAPEACSGSDCEVYYCNEVFEETGGLVPSDEIIDPSGQALIEVSDASRRMASSYEVSLAYGESGYNPQRVAVSYDSQIDNYTADNADDDGEEEDSARYLIVGALVLLAFI